MKNKLNIQSIFDSIDGEENGFDGAGQLTTFIRLKKCNLKCKWCDTKYAQESTPENWMTVGEVIKQIHFSKVTITGGEPLLQKFAVADLCTALIYGRNSRYHKISIETNGTIQPAYFHPAVRWIVDFKLPSSGVMDKMNSLAFSSLRSCDVMKFVISDEEDYEYAKMLISEHPNWKARKVFSPAVEDQNNYTGWPAKLVEMMVKDRADAQFSLQIHKVLFPYAECER